MPKVRIRRKKIKVRKVKRYIILGGFFLLVLGFSNRALASQGPGTDVYAYTGPGMPAADSSYFSETILPAINRNEELMLGSRNSPDTFSSQTISSEGYPTFKLSTMLLLGSLAIGLFGTAGIKKRFRV